MSPTVKICNEFKWFLSLRCIAPPESSMGYWEKIGNRKSEQRKETELMQTINYEHVFPLLKTCDFSPLEHQAYGVSFFPRVFSPPIDMIKLWCDDLSLPLWHQFPRRVLLDFCHDGFGPWVTEQSSNLSRMLVEDNLSEAGSKRIQKQVARCFSCSEIGSTEFGASVAPKGFGWTEVNSPVWPSSS